MEDIFSPRVSKEGKSVYDCQVRHDERVSNVRYLATAANWRIISALNR
jgi:hypothetical protein